MTRQRALVALAAVAIVLAGAAPTLTQQVADLQSRVASLELRVTRLEAGPGPSATPRPTSTPSPTVTPAPTPTPTITPRPAVVARIDSSETVPAFQLLASDMSIDVIELVGGTYRGGGRGWRQATLNADRTARPLTIRPTPGATVIFDAAGDGDYGDAPFRIGGAHITFDGSTGRFRFQHYLLAQEGLFTFVGARFIAIDGVTVRNVAGNANASTEQAAHVLYVSRGSHDLTFDDFDVAAIQATDEPGGVHGLNGLHEYLGCSVDRPCSASDHVRNLAARRWIVDRANWAAVLRDGAAGVVLDTWAVTNSGHAVPAVIDLGADNTGTVSNVRTSGSLAAPVIWGRMTDGGGNALG